MLRKPCIEPAPPYPKPIGVRADNWDMGVPPDGDQTQAARQPFFVTFLRTRSGQFSVAVVAAMAIAAILRLVSAPSLVADLPLIGVVVVIGIGLLVTVIRGIIHRTIGADVLGLLALVASAALREWWIAAIIALMLTSGEGLEAAASARASALLDALGKRAPSIAHRQQAGSGTTDIEVDQVQIGDALVVLPHEICPVDGVVIDGRGAMDESYLTGEPYVIPKIVGSPVLAGAINSDYSLTIQATKPAHDSRYANIVGILAVAETQRPPIRRLADGLGLACTLIAVAIACTGWIISADPNRFLAVVVVATPCSLLIGIPVTVIGAISLSARNGIIIKNPAILERLNSVRTMIFDKTGTLTYGRPSIWHVFTAPGFDEPYVLRLAASIEQYSRHPLAKAVVAASPDGQVLVTEAVSETPGHGLRGRVDGHDVEITGRKALTDAGDGHVEQLPPPGTGLECIIMVDGQYAATLRFRDVPRTEARAFIEHLQPAHAVMRTMILSGDRAIEVDSLAHDVGISDARSSLTPEEKLDIVRTEVAKAPTAFCGDGINDAPAMTAATVGIAFSRNNDVTAEAADAVVLDSSLAKLDELLHIGNRMRRIALQTAIGGIAASCIGMLLAVFGLLPPIVGAVSQELIDVLAILNASRVAFGHRSMSDIPDPEK